MSDKVKSDLLRKLQFGTVQDLINTAFKMADKFDIKIQIEVPIPDNQPLKVWNDLEDLDLDRIRIVEIKK